MDPIFWRPDVFPGTVIVAPGPESFSADCPLSLASLDQSTGDHESGGYLALPDPEGCVYLSLSPCKNGEYPAVILPLDEIAELRLEAAARLLRRLSGRLGGPLPNGLRLTQQRRLRMIQRLHALDFHLAGASPREIATALIDADAVKLRAVEWKDSAARTKAKRLVKEAQALMTGGYRKLLRGG